MTNLLPENKHLIGRVLRADQVRISPKIGKIRGFWEIIADYYGKNCEKAQKAVPDGLKTTDQFEVDQTGGQALGDRIGRI
jgi:hypothetical protein